MAKALIVAFLLCIVGATVATADTPTTKATTTTTSLPTTKPTTKATTTTATPSPSTSTMKATTTTTLKAPTSTPSTGTPSTGTPSTGTPSTGTPSTGTPSTGTPSTGTPSTGSPSTGTPSTGTPPTEGSSVSPNTGSSQTNAPSTAPVTATPKPPGACASNPCGGGSTCEERADQSFACLCLSGDVHDGSFCQRAKVFPGLLVLKKDYNEEMADKTSQIFKETAENITDEIDDKFNGGSKEYHESFVLELREGKPNARSQRQTGNVEASIEIRYESTAKITQDEVTKIMDAVACDECPLVGSFTAKSLCDSNSCDALSTKCSSAGGSFTCSCGEGFKETDYSDRLCIAACPVGEMYVNNKCKPCNFGYAGFNCKDNTLLIVVIVCSILGFLLIAALIALPLVVKKSKKKSSRGKEEDIVKPYQSHSTAKAPLSYTNGNSNDFSASVKEPTNSLANSGAPRIPRATANSNWDSRTNLEMTPSNSRQNLIPSGMNSQRFNDNQDDMYSFSQNRPKNHPYEEVQPKSNPYTQDRASNPYAQIRGQTNPYYN